MRQNVILHAPKKFWLQDYPRENENLFWEDDTDTSNTTPLPDYITHDRMPGRFVEKRGA